MKTNKSGWHKEILTSASREVLNDLFRTIPLSQFYLAGGTGLALLLGHRLSRDFDFFSNQLFNEDALIQKMQGLNDITIIAKSEQTIHINLKELKVSFLGYTYPLLYHTKQYQPVAGMSIDVADERDIACMKISAICSRGTKRDFVDLYEVARQYTLPELFVLFQQKFSLTPYNNVHILKSLTYFADAELGPMPDMLIPLSWDTVKKFFVSEIPKLL
ncbi:MAG TPA: nucleotidyl transferase AbiEii/AbiGii toxin family protein [Ignavibacteriaceae bacterium]|nr:nucleotidyl transferase AbiEii/AbiGii toxin family protein [Ignavibacteriaceae bacterium]